jgi:hypothetical protein
MALTKRQEITLYQVLGVPYGTTVNRLRNEDNTMALAYTVTGSQAAHLHIQASLTDLSDEMESELVECLDMWYEMLGDSTRMDAGQVGGTNGVSFDLVAERNMLRERILVIIPYSKEYFENEIGRMQRDRISLGVLR